MKEIKSPLDSFKLQYEELQSAPKPVRIKRKRVFKPKLKPLHIYVRSLGLPKVVIVNRNHKAQEVRP